MEFYFNMLLNVLFSEPSAEEEVRVKPPIHTTTENNMIGIIIGTLAALIVILFAGVCIVIVIIRHKRSKQNNNRHCLKPVMDRHIAVNINDVRNQNGKISNGNMYNSVATDDMESDRELCRNGIDHKLCKDPYSDPKDSLEGRQLLPDHSGSTSGRMPRGMVAWYIAILYPPRPYNHITNSIYQVAYIGII